MKILTTDRIKDIINALNPWYTGRQQDALVAALDEAADQAGDYAYELVQPLMDFRSDIQSPAGAGMVGLLDTNGNFTGTSVEEALEEVYNLALAGGGGGGVSVVDSIVDGDTLNAPSRNSVFDALALKADSTSVVASLALKADLASPTFTGTPSGPTPLTSDNSTALATTAYVKGQGYTSNTGTVTSVNATGSTGLTVSGGPITGSGSLGLTLSANLQAWSALATSSKANTNSPAFTGTPTYDSLELGWRKVPYTNTNANYTMVADDAAKMRAASTTGWTYTINGAVFSAGDVVTVMNQSTGSLTIAQGSGGMGLYLAGSAGASGNRTVAARGIATIYFINGNTAIVSGNVT